MVFAWPSHGVSTALESPSVSLIAAIHTDPQGLSKSRFKVIESPRYGDDAGSVISPRADNTFSDYLPALENSAHVLHAHAEVSPPCAALIDRPPTSEAGSSHVQAP